MTDKAEAAPKTKAHSTDFTRKVNRFELFSAGLSEPLAARFKMLEKAARSAPRRALIAVALAWGGLLVLSLLAGRALGPGGLLGDASVFGRFAIATGLLVMMDRRVDSKLRGYLVHFTDAPLISPASMPQAGRALAKAIDRARAPLPTLICALLACLISLGFTLVQLGNLDGLPASWRFAGAPEAMSLSAAGWWASFVSIPLLSFLMLRALWRYAVWVLLLRRIASLELRLVATHPDGAGGLRFLGQNPNVFTTLAFAMSVCVAGYVLKGLQSEQLDTGIYSMLMSAWAGFIVFLFSAPLLAFAKPLSALKTKPRLAAAARATVNQRAAEREIFGRNFAGWREGDTEESPADKDATKVDEAARKLSTLAFSRSAVVPLGFSALLPLVAVGATQLPFKELFKAAKGLLLL
jgi:hypothetical protein